MLGRGMSTMSDEGQHFTNRAICKLAFELAYNIKKNLRRADGSLCTFADWFCGTGGFASAFVKGVQQKLGPVDWKKEQGAVCCQDMSVSFLTTAMLNMLILTGVPFSAENFHNGNSLTEPVVRGPQAPFRNRLVDYLFMNPP